ncbi:hypothetical protein L484_005675 [Morus notabilis]|uniref:Uncharacterized protein n=1 Tax=Morus notabilis TaxID=981085 RepID=W9S6K0_9ROSA|nr:hypothetical protein L484_005675 [Morus notabilis]
MCRMHRDTFEAIVQLIRGRNLLPSSSLSAEESLMMFLRTVAHSDHNREIQDRFCHSGETVHQHFDNMLTALSALAPDVIKLPNMNIVPPEIQHNPKYWPWFKDCIGAIDGTHLMVVPPAHQQTVYRGRKHSCTQNTMAACSFDMLFTYVNTGWEGSAADSRVLTEILRNPDDPFVAPLPPKYYVVDSGYSNTQGFLAPFRGQRQYEVDFPVEDIEGEGEQEGQQEQQHGMDAQEAETSEMDGQQQRNYMVDFRDHLANQMWDSYRRQ